MIIEWPPIPLYIAFAVVATWTSVLGAELRKEDINPKEQTGLSRLRKILQWGGIASAIHLLAYLLLACCKTISGGHFLSMLSVMWHISIVCAVMYFMTSMFSVSFRGKHRAGG